MQALNYSSKPYARAFPKLGNKDADKMPSLTIDIAENEHLKKLTYKTVRNATLSEHENGLNKGFIAASINSAKQSQPDVHI